ncbi:hypothetical protein [Lunatimonas salinarum]|uniref:hypothetical protein n=1 Tax=Lunatimonas salinarum TaxID=1774590 RepID=UPI001ADF744D|nr:hypothetical protein [Lunatimonas salinarum]
MKKVVVFLALVLTCTTLKAQYKGQGRVQYANDMGFRSGLLGMNIGAEYFFLDNLSFSPSFSILFPATGKASNLHLDARYYLTEETTQWYGLIGFANFRRRYELNPEIPLRNEPTLNLGGGLIHKLIDEIGINGEIKWQPQSNSDFILKIGVLYFVN